MRIKTFIYLFFSRLFPFLFKSKLKPKLLTSPVKEKLLWIEGRDFAFVDRCEKPRVPSLESAVNQLIGNINGLTPAHSFAIPYRTNGADRRRRSNRLHISRRARRKNR